MQIMRARVFLFITISFVISQISTVNADLIPVRHIEGELLGFLVLRNLDGQALAYGDVQQVVKEEDGLVVDDLELKFKDGSFYEEITKFTQHGKFRLVTDQVEQKGPSFKQDVTSWIDAKTGKVTVRTTDKGKEKITTKHLDLPDDVSNGLLFVLLKNVNPSAAETVSFVAASATPRLVKLNIFPGQEKTVKVGLVTYRAQHYIVKTKIEGVAGKVAPLIGKQPPDMHVWLVKSEAPIFVEFEGPLSADGPVWRMELAAPEPDSAAAKNE